MGQSYRIRTELGINKTINIELEQEFEFLEILSLKLNQQDIYLRACSDYGVIVGRVTANNGLGLPNARVSIFIPIDSIDESNPVISSIYPYKSPDDKNEDGFRYNLLPYEKSYSTHSATGTLPTRLDVLTGNTAYEIYDKYYKFTAKTNESGDYMIMGVPTGQQTVVMDVDLSDIGEFSLTPQDLIRIGRATEAQVAGNRFRASNDLNSLPQIVNLSKYVEISPLWGEPSICQIAINRVDFDLRDEANIDIQPTSVFMGSIYSTADNFRLRPDIKILGLPISSSRPKDNFGNLCSLTTGPGQILAIRQTIFLDVSGNPILEEYKLEQNGNVIDENGAWLVELPMNLDYFITNEFGERVISYDPTIGIPTKAKYRFKVKWQQAASFSESVRRPYYLVPNVREFGWSPTNKDLDPNISNAATQSNKNKLKSSYYFGLDWSGYTYGFNATEAYVKINEMINCEDTFYQFEFNKVYTVSGLIDQYKNGGRGRFIGIKEIDDSACDDTVNKFPVNEGFRNFDFLYFIVSIILQLFQIISAPLIVIIHFVAWLTDTLIKLKDLLLLIFGFLVAFHIFQGIKLLSLGIGYLTGSGVMRVVARVFDSLATVIDSSASASAASGTATPAAPGLSAAAQATRGSAGLARSLGTVLRTSGRNFIQQAIKSFATALKYLIWGIILRKIFSAFQNQKVRAISLPVILYPECTACECGSTDVTGGQKLVGNLSSLLTRFSDPGQYYSLIERPGYLPQVFFDEENETVGSFSFAQAIGGSIEDPNNIEFYKTMESPEYQLLKDNGKVAVDYFAYSNDLPFGERVNIFNQRKKYFDGVNRIKVTFDSPINTGFHFDNTLTIFTETPLETGALLTFVDPQTSTDLNYQYTGATSSGDNPGIKSTVLNAGPSNYTVYYCNTSDPYSNSSVSYNLSKGTEFTGYTYPADVEYYQVVTAITVTEAVRLFAGQPAESLPAIINSSTTVLYNNRSYVNFLGLFPIQTTWGSPDSATYRIRDIFENFDSQYITILQRGVDPYSPKYTNKFGLGLLFGFTNPDDLIVTASTRINIPIQKLNSTSLSVQNFTPNGQAEIFYPSHFIQGGVSNSQIVGEQWSAFTTPNVGYYGSLDALRIFPRGSTVGPASPVQNARLSTSANGAYGAGVAKYNSAEDVSGCGFYYVNDGNRPANTSVTYYTNVFLPSFTATPMNITSRTLNIMRTDRLPSSDNLDGGSWNLNPALLQQNLGFAIYELTEAGNEQFGYVKYGTGADIPPPDITGQFADTNVLTTLDSCSQVVSLQCYVGNGTGFTINKNCVDADAVVNGCYRFVQRPLKDIRKDIRNFNEWAYRFRFFFALCRGVLSQSFTNNWINGSLFTFPIQVDVTFNSSNRPNPPEYPKKVIYYDTDTNNFYFRSSPFISGTTTTEFIGRPTTDDANPVNKRNLLFPTTIMNLGMKDYFYREIILDPSTNAYVMNNLNPSSYSDNSDIVNLFVLSRITNASFLQQMLNLRDYSVSSLFTRYPTNNPIIQPKNRVDADLVQMLSINNEVGVIPFTPEYYTFNSNSANNAVVVLAQTNRTSTMGIFFSSTTEDLQTKDFLSPGLIDFRFNPNVTAVTYKFGIKSQVVPFYQWQLYPGASQLSIFGSEFSNWATNMSDIVKSEYQNLDRRNLVTPNYFVPSITSFDVNQRGYIFNKDASGLYQYAVFPGMKSKFLIGAPNQFYFGVVKGASAMDKFKEKYLPNE